MDPPSRSVNCLTMANPSPRPPWLRVVVASCWLKRSKIRGKNPVDSPAPIAHADPESTRRLAPALELDLRAANGELHRIAQKIGDDLMQPRRVRIHFSFFIARIVARGSSLPGRPADVFTTSSAARTIGYGSMVSATRRILPKVMPA